MLKCLIATSVVLVTTTLSAQNPSPALDPTMPPLIEWKGKSRSLIAAKSDPWITPSEMSNLERTPRYAETVSWLRRLDEASPLVKLVSIGKSSEGRDIWMVVASKEGASTPEAIRKNGRPTLLAQGGIHAGEIDGKDAGLMLLRDLTVSGSKKSLLDRVNLLFVPIFNVDGHERSTKFGRINQRGPVESGWRTTARNLNLNRDYMKIDSPEMEAMIRTLHRWQPDLYLDLHVTDGADYQYDITWGHNAAAHSPRISTWLEQSFTPAVQRDLTAAGHIPGPLVFGLENDLTKGLAGWNSDPRFSTGYGDLRHLPTVLVENHSLKPYDQRVLGTYVLLESSMRLLGSEGAGLRRAALADAATRRASVPVSWAPAEGAPAMIDFLGVESRQTLSTVSGGVRTEWLGRPVAMKVPLIQFTKVAASVKRPRAYWISPVWSEVIRRLELHGIVTERISADRQVRGEMVRFSEPKIESAAFEGHVRVTAKASVETRSELFPTGSIRVSTDQPLGDVAIFLLEPDSPDSFFQWGFFHEILSPTEYVEEYIMDPTAERMLAADPKLAEEYRQKLLSDEKFRGSSQERLQWFYRKTPFYDDRARLYPVLREVE